MRSVCAIAALAVALLTPIAASADTTGSVRGYVIAGSYRHDYATQLIPHVVVTYSSPAGVFSAHTDDNGFYAIFDMPPGEYVIYATTPQIGYDLLLGSYHVCVHAGEDTFRNLTIGFRDLPIRSAIERFDYIYQFRPDVSQTADLYSLGDC